MRRKLTSEVLASIKVDREEHGLAMPALMVKYALSRGSVSTAIQGLSASRVVRAAPGRKAPQRPIRAHLVRPPLSTTDLGETVRFLAVGRMVLAGLTPFVPVRESTAIDILILRQDGGLSKCQCKWMWQDKAGAHVLKICTMRNAGTGKRSATPYTESEVDFFVGYCADNGSFYIIPRAVAYQGRGKELRVWITREPSGNGRRSFDASAYKDAFHLLACP